MIAAEISGAEAAVARLATLPDAVNAGLARAIAGLGAELQQRVQDKLAGQPLQTRSGRLRSSIDLSIQTNASASAATVSTALDYARAQEFGFSGVVGIRASLRRIREAFGRPIAEKVINVRAYRRRFDLPGRSFLGSALDDMTPEIGAEIDAALRGAVQP
ncbi:MAG TPA: hypothetical protein VFQ82_04670 [Stellaceae bacterium]|nr:hypothetical protein [Stellaceae bacterium]